MPRREKELLARDEKQGEPFTLSTGISTGIQLIEESLLKLETTPSVRIRRIGAGCKALCSWLIAEVDRRRTSGVTLRALQRRSGSCMKVLRAAKPRCMVSAGASETKSSM